MKKNIFNFTFCLLCVICIFFIFSHNSDVARIIITAVNLFLNKVFVSLFPMFIINDILIALSFPFYFYIIFKTLFKKLFKTSGICAYVFFMSLISGTPSNAYILKSLVENKNITELEATHYLTFTYFSNPLFLIMMLSTMFSSHVVVKLILIHYISNLIIGFLVRRNAPSISDSLIEENKVPVSEVLIRSIKKSIETLLMILGTIVFYMLLSYIITNILPFNDFTKIIFSGFLEITNGLNSLINFSAASKLKEIISVVIISFGGFSIHTQIKSILEDTNINYNAFLKGRIYQALISFVLVLIF